MTNIPLCIYITISLSTHLLKNADYIHILVNNATMNVGVYVSFQISVFVFFVYLLSSGNAGSFDSSIFSFLRSLHTVPEWPHQFTILPTVYRDSLFCVSSPTVVICDGFDDSDRCEVNRNFLKVFY